MICLQFHFYAICYFKRHYSYNMRLLILLMINKASTYSSTDLIHSMVARLLTLDLVLCFHLMMFMLQTYFQLIYQYQTRVHLSARLGHEVSDTLKE